MGAIVVFFFMELEFLELELHVKLEFSKGGRLLIILKTVVDCKIFWPKMVFGQILYMLLM